MDSDEYLKDIFLTLTGSVLYTTVGILTVFYHDDKVLEQVTKSRCNNKNKVLDFLIVYYIMYISRI